MLEEFKIQIKVKQDETSKNYLTSLLEWIAEKSKEAYLNGTIKGGKWRVSNDRILSNIKPTIARAKYFIFVILDIFSCVKSYINYAYHVIVTTSRV